MSAFASCRALSTSPKRRRSPAVIAVDMPIGLPERTGPGGRAAENAIRPLLGARQSSVFSVPSRTALEAIDYREACGIALTTSEPPRKISKQLFMIAPKIREVDSALRERCSAGGAHLRGASRSRLLAAEWRTSADRAQEDQGQGLRAGLRLRRELLIAAGLPRDRVEAAPPAGAAADDLLDALACAAIARRIHAGIARPFPDPPPRDALRVADGDLDVNKRSRSPAMPTRGSRSDRNKQSCAHEFSEPPSRRLQRLPRWPLARGTKPLSGSRGKGPIAGNHGDRLLRFPCLAGSHFRCRAGRTFLSCAMSPISFLPTRRTDSAHGVSAALEFGVAR